MSVQLQHHEEQRHDVAGEPSLACQECVERPERGAAPAERLEIRAGVEAGRALVPAHELNAAEAGPPVRGEAGERGGVAAVYGERGHDGEAVGEVRRDESVPLRGLLRRHGRRYGVGGGRCREGEELVAPRRHQREVEPLQRREPERRPEEEERVRAWVPA